MNTIGIPATPASRLRRLLTLIVACAFIVPVFGAVPVDIVVDLSATVSPSAPPHITLTWTQRLQNIITSQKIHRRLKGQTSWTLLQTLTNTQTSYADATALPGLEYEYWMERRFSGSGIPELALGYLSAGVNVPAVEARGILLLVIDDTLAAPLAPEITQLENDLIGDGWTVVQMPVSRTASPASIRSQIQTAYNAAPAQVKAVYLLGHVPVPYSGISAPDGHNNHVGAWPADVYYGELDGAWTDTIANYTVNGPRQDNVPGDGKYDNSFVPGKVELQVGRVDLSLLTKAPLASETETVLLRRYLRKAHEFRHRLGAYASVPRRSLMRDGLGFSNGEAFAAAGWAAAFSSVGKDVEQPGSDQWFSRATDNTYLWGYGCGPGSAESAGGVGSTTEFGLKPSRVLFTGFFGSYFGDWDAPNNLLRAVLAGNATGDSLGLASFWSGRPYWLLHPCAMGETLGYAARLTQNNGDNNYQPGGGFTGGSFVGLMGDPALRFHMVEPPRNLSATSASGAVQLKWDATTETAALGYHVFRAASPTGAFTRLTATPLTGTTYTDSTVTTGTAYRYLVRTLKLETTPGGTYQNLSIGSLAKITATSATSGAPFNPGTLSVEPLAATQTRLTWRDNSTNETGFLIERRTTSGGAFTSIGSVSADTTTFTDPGPLAHGSVYTWRVIATGTAGDSQPSEEVTASGHAGFYRLTSAVTKVSRASGTVALDIERFGGGSGASQVTAATTNVSAIAGTHYTAMNGPVTYADGVKGLKTVTITLPASGSPQLPRQFNFAISNPTGGAAFAGTTIARVVIEDPAATLAAPWQQTILGGGGGMSGYSPAASAEGAIGSAVCGGSSSDVDNGRFIYQSHTGDGVFTAYIDTPLPAQAAARFALMVRRSNDRQVQMAAAMVAGDNTGSSLSIRNTDWANQVRLPATGNALLAPCWIRLTRTGDSFTAERSTDGTTWLKLGTSTLALPATANWGLFHSSNRDLQDYQLARFRNVTLRAPDAFDRWAAQAFSETQRADPAVSGPSATPFGDGVPNLLRAALGATPGSPAVTLPSATVEAGHLTLRYRQLSGGQGTPGINYIADGLSYVVEASDSLASASWRVGTDVVEPVGSPQASADAGVEIVTVRLKASLANMPRAFLRLKVSQVQPAS